jgi:uncharacterized Zn-binding protein involved in type VI secretion
MKVAVLNDSSDHTLGQILEGGTFPTVTVQGKAIAISNAQTPTIGAGADQCGCPDDHTLNTGASQGSFNVTAGGNKVHRVGDSRGCGAKTVIGTSLRTVNAN